MQVIPGHCWIHLQSNRSFFQDEDDPEHASERSIDNACPVSITHSLHPPLESIQFELATNFSPETREIVSPPLALPTAPHSNNRVFYPSNRSGGFEETRLSDRGNIGGTLLPGKSLRSDLKLDVCARSREIFMGQGRSRSRFADPGFV